MIVFDLCCAAGDHRFEAWFASSDSFADQQTRGLIGCPVCGDAQVRKAVMAPRVGAKSNQQAAPAPAPTTRTTPTPAAEPIGRAHDRTPVTKAHLVSRYLLATQTP